MNQVAARAAAPGGGWGFTGLSFSVYPPETSTNTRSIDVDGDGRADLLFADSQGFLAFRSVSTRR